MSQQGPQITAEKLEQEVKAFRAMRDGTLPYHLSSVLFSLFIIIHLPISIIYCF